jgi:hypothetical protein
MRKSAHEWGTQQSMELKKASAQFSIARAGRRHFIGNDGLRKQPV